MANFAFKGRRSGGAETSGEVQAASVGAAAKELQRQGIRPVQLLARDEQSLGVTGPLGALLERFERVTEDELILFARQMRSLTRSGIPLGRALRGLSESTRGLRLREILDSLATQIESGMQLSTAMRRHRKVFPELFVNLVQVGEQTGSLDRAFDQMVAYMQLERETRRRVTSATRYPMFVLLAMAAAVAIVNLYVIPAFAEVFARYGAELPWQTRVLLGTSQFFQDGWPVMGVAIVGGGGWWTWWTRTAAGRYFRDGLLLRLPLLGDLYRRILVGRLCRTLAMVFRSGIPLIQGLRFAADALDNAVLAERAGQIRLALERGESLTRAARSVALFTPIVTQMIATGEETGDLDGLLDQAADFYEEEIDYQLDGLTAAIEPILIICMGVMVLILALGVFLPLWDLSSATNH